MGIKKKTRSIIAYLNLFRFSLRKYFVGFDNANNFIKRVDKTSLKLILRINGALIGDNCDIETGLVFHNCKDYSNFIIGNNCHIGKNCFFDLREKIEIKNNVVVSMQCTFITHIDIDKSKLSSLYPSFSKCIVINENCYVGVKSTLLLGVELGANSMVGSCSLVKDNVDEFKLVGGIPAKIIKDLKKN